MIREGVSLVHADGWWTLKFGRYGLYIQACTCDLPPCTCKRRPAMTWYRSDSHERTHCHRGHPEHIAVILRKALR